MSAKSAAAALLRHDAELAAFAASINFGRSNDKGLLVREYVRENVMNTWTLALVADAVGCSEEQVISALLYLLRAGSTCICRMEAAALFRGGEAQS